MAKELGERMDESESLSISALNSGKSSVAKMVSMASEEIMRPQENKLQEAIKVLSPIQKTTEVYLHPIVVAGPGLLDQESKIASALNTPPVN